MKQKLTLLFLALLTTAGMWAEDWTPSISSKALIDVGEKVSSVTPATSASDNAHWYLITQVRGGESAIYDTGSQVKRGSTSATAASFEYTSATTNAAYLVRFISTGETDTYNIQFGNGRYVKAYESSVGNVALETATTPGTYVFYNCNSGSGSYFGWNLNTKGAKIVDNNGAGNTVAFWETGTVSGTSGNNVYYVYEVAFEEGINVTYNLYESDGETFVSSQTVVQRKSSSVSVPSSLKSGYRATDYDYATSGTIGTSDCSITVTRTIKTDPYIPSFPVGAYIGVGAITNTMTPVTTASDNNHWYVLTQYRDAETPLYDNTTYGQIMRAISSFGPSAIDGLALDGNKKYLVRFIESGEDDLYYVQFANGNYITESLTSAQTKFSAGKFAFYNTGDANTLFGWNLNSYTGSRVNNNGAGSNVVLWGSGKNTSTTTSGVNDVWSIYPVEITVPSYFVQYEISDGSGVIFTSDEIPASNGDVITELPSVLERAFCSYEVTETTVTSSGVTTVPVTMTWNGPFNISASFATADWKLLQMRQGGYNVKYVADAASYPLEAKGLMKTENDAYLWAFIGNPYDGFEIVNKAAGNTKTLYAGASPANGGYPLMSAENTTKWLVNGNPKNNEAGGFGLQVPGRSLYINDYSGAKKMSYWQDNTTADAGSTLTVADQYPLLVANSISPYFSNQDTYFSLKSTAENLSTYSTKCTAALTSCDKDAYDDLVDYVTDAGNIYYPATGYYRIKNVSSGNYVGYGTAGYGGKGVGLIEVSANDPSSVLHLTKVSDGVYTISTQGLNVQKQSTRNMPVTLSSSAGVSHTFTPLLGRATSIRADLEDSKGYWFRSSWGSAPESIITWDASSDAAKWTVEDASSVSVDLHSDGADTYYTTLYLPFDATISGADAFTLSKSGSYLIPAAVPSNQVPAGTPVLLKGSSATATATINTGAAFNSGSPLACNLTGTYVDMSVAKTEGVSNDYYLGIDGSTVGFYKWDGTTLKANRAYLDQSTAEAAVKGYILMFDDDATSINSLTPALSEGEGAIYNLAGQRVSKMQKGINIVNGKKIMVK